MAICELKHHVGGLNGSTEIGRKYQEVAELNVPIAIRVTPGRYAAERTEVRRQNEEVCEFYKTIFIKITHRYVLVTWIGAPSRYEARTPLPVNR